MKINAEDKEVERLKKVVLRLGRWQDIKESGAWLSVITGCYFLLKILGLSGITVLSIFTLCQLTTFSLLINYEQSLKQRNLFPANVDAEDFVTVLFEIIETEIYTVSSGLGIVARNAFRSYHSLLNDDDLARHLKFIAGFFFISVINWVLPVYVMIFILGFNLFTFPIAYDRWHDPIEKRISKLYRTQSDFFNSLRST